MDETVEVEVFELVGDDSGGEVDPFASETESQSSEYNEEIEVDNMDSGKDVRVHVPFVNKEVVIVHLQCPYTVEKLFETLKEEQPAAFDSQGKFNGNLYDIVGKKLFVDDNNAENDTENAAKIVMIHRLESNAVEAVVEEIVEESEDVKGDMDTNLKTKTLMSRFKNLWSKKPSKDVCIQNGNIDSSVSSNSSTESSSVFGKGLDEYPEFITDVLEYLGDSEQIQEGLFRLSGTFTRIQTLKDRIDAGESLKQMNLTASDCHNVTSLLKQYLRNFPQPLLTFELYEAWQTLGTWTAMPEVSVKIARFLINRLPAVNRKILRELAGFLNERLADAEVTRMNACNYGTVIGPNLLWHQQEDRHTKHSTTLGLSLQSTTLASQIFTLMLQHYAEIFGEEIQKDEIIVAYGRVLYDYTCEDGRDEEDAIENADTEDTFDSNDTASPAGFRENDLVFVTGIEDSPDGWWLGYLHPSTHPTKFPSNYLQIQAQIADEEILERIRKASEE